MYIYNIIYDRNDATGHKETYAIFHVNEDNLKTRMHRVFADGGYNVRVELHCKVEFHYDKED